MLLLLLLLLLWIVSFFILTARGGQTNTASALRTARTEVFVPSGGDRDDVSDLVILLTDGVPTIEEVRLNSIAS